MVVDAFTTRCHRALSKHVSGCRKKKQNGSKCLKIKKKYNSHRQRRNNKKKKTEISNDTNPTPATVIRLYCKRCKQFIRRYIMFTEIVTEINRQRASRIVREWGRLFMFCRKAGLGIAMPSYPIIILRIFKTTMIYDVIQQTNSSSVKRFEIF